MTNGMRAGHLRLGMTGARTTAISTASSSALAISAMHRPACVTDVIGNAAFAGDALFMPDFGSAGLPRG